MNAMLKKVKELIIRGEVKISEHGYDELAEDGIFVREVISGISDAEVLEDYPEYHKGPCILVLENDMSKKPIHAVWGIPKSKLTPAVLITAYRPDKTRWSSDFRRRIK
jgi:hypothetical protein